MESDKVLASRANRASMKALLDPEAPLKAQVAALRKQNLLLSQRLAASERRLSSCEKKIKLLSAKKPPARVPGMREVHAKFRKLEAQIARAYMRPPILDEP